MMRAHQLLTPTSAEASACDTGKTKHLDVKLHPQMEEAVLQSPLEPGLLTVVLRGEATRGEACSSLQGIEVHDWDAFLGLGKGKPAEPVPPKPEDPATIMYTSGTTGLPPAPLPLGASHAPDCHPAAQAVGGAWSLAADQTPPQTCCAAGSPAVRPWLVL